MEPEGSLPCSQKLDVGPYSASAESSSPHLSLSPNVHLNVILPPTPRSSQWSLPFGPPNQNPGRLERELQMVQLSATMCSCIAILWFSLVRFAAITLYIASQRVFIIVYFVMTQSGNFWIHPSIGMSHMRMGISVIDHGSYIKRRTRFDSWPEHHRLLSHSSPPVWTTSVCYGQIRRPVQESWKMICKTDKKSTPVRKLKAELTPKQRKCS
jgi:hypothetical protein